MRGCEEWAVLLWDVDRGLSVEHVGEDPWQLADQVARWVRAEDAFWPEIGQIYMLVTSQQAEEATGEYGGDRGAGRTGDQARARAMADHPAGTSGDGRAVDQGRGGGAGLHRDQGRAPGQRHPAPEVGRAAVPRPATDPAGPDVHPLHRVAAPTLRAEGGVVTEPAAHDVYRHREDGLTCILGEDGYWFVPLDVGGEGYGCDREHGPASPRHLRRIERLQRAVAKERMRSRMKLANAWSWFLSMALDEKLDDETPMMAFVLEVNPDLKARLEAALERGRTT